MIVPIPAWFYALVLLAGAVLVAIVVAAVFLFLRGARASGITRRGWALLLLGLVVGLASGALAWVEPSLTGIGTPIVMIVGVALLALAFMVGRRPAGHPMLVALLGAGLLYQLGWAGGGFMFPEIPIVGDALADERCQRDPYCQPSSMITTAAQVELRIQAPDSDTRVSGEPECMIDPRPNAAMTFILHGTLHDGAGRELNIQVEVAPSYDGGPEPIVYFYLDGALDGFDEIRGEASGRWSLTDSDSASAGTITFDEMHMERVRPGANLYTQEHVFDHAHGTLNWDCR